MTFYIKTWSKNILSFWSKAPKSWLLPTGRKELSTKKPTTSLLKSIEPRSWSALKSTATACASRTTWPNALLTSLSPATLPNSVSFTSPWRPKTTESVRSPRYMIPISVDSHSRSLSCTICSSCRRPSTGRSARAIGFRGYAHSVLLCSSTMHRREESRSRVNFLRIRREIVL